MSGSLVSNSGRFSTDLKMCARVACDRVRIRERAKESATKEREREKERARESEDVSS